MSASLISFAYIAAAVCFILGLKLLGSPTTARRGNLLSALGMGIAVVVALLDKQILSYEYILAGILIGALLGTLAARLVAMTAMPEMVALFNGFGGLASLLVGWAALATLLASGGAVPPFTRASVFASILIGGLAFTGSLLAYGKLSEILPGRPFVYPGQRVVNGLIVLAVLACAGLFMADAANSNWLYLAVGLALLLGIMFVLPIGGGDMPVVIALLNSFSGVAAAAAGFAIGNILLIVAGSLVGASGIILTTIMCKAMNRSLANVLFSGFGAVRSAANGPAVERGEVKPISAEDAYFILEAASSVVIIPGYGLAVAQAQHAVRELQQILQAHGCEAVFAIHPVAGRMPGHMNVLLAEADVPYDLLLEMEQVNPRMDSFDVAVVIGANDVVNPAAHEIASSPIYGMPIIEADRARTVFVLKRSMASGFAGIDNPLFFKDNTRMLFGDAKKTLGDLIKAFD